MIPQRICTYMPVIKIKLKKKKKKETNRTKEEEKNDYSPAATDSG